MQEDKRSLEDRRGSDREDKVHLTAQSGRKLEVEREGRLHRFQQRSFVADHKVEQGCRQFAVVHDMSTTMKKQPIFKGPFQLQGG